MRISLIIAFIFLTNLAYSCSCLPLGKIDDKQYNEYDLIFSSNIVKVVAREYQITIVVKVINIYKGVRVKNRIKIVSPKGDGICGISPKPGEDWLMFIRESDKEYHTHLCTRTKNMNPKAPGYRKDELVDDVKFLQNKLPKYQYY